MKINVVEVPSLWAAEWFDTPWFFTCQHPVELLGPETYESFDGEVFEVTVCSECGEEIEL